LDDPAAKIAKWISNLERHEETTRENLTKTEKELAILNSKRDELASQLKATQAWLKKFADLSSILESTNRESGDLLETDVDADVFKSQHGTHFERIEAYLISKNNSPLTVVELSEATDIPRTSLSAVLYRTHSEAFKAEYVPGKRGKVWALQNPPSKLGAGETDVPAPPELPDGNGEWWPSDEDYPPPPEGGEIPF